MKLEQLKGPVLFRQNGHFSPKFCHNKNNCLYITVFDNDEAKKWQKTLYKDGYSQQGTKGGAPTITLQGKFLNRRRVPPSSSMDTGGQGDVF